MLSSPLARRRILLVEDDQMVRETVELMLEEDYEVDCAVSIRTALEHLRAPEPRRMQVVLLDCLLPDGDLTDVLAEADRQMIPVVLISGDPHQADDMDPPRRFLSKPFTRLTLLKILDTARG